MQVMTRVLALLGFILWTFLTASGPALADRPRPLGNAMEAVRAGSWDNAAKIAIRDGQVAADIVEWHRLRAGRGTFAEARDFLIRRPDWPGLPWLRRKSEGALEGQPGADVLAFFAKSKPQTGAGVLAFAAALKSSGKPLDADYALETAWQTLKLTEEEHTAFLDAHAALLKPHHEKRLDQMLWRGWFDDAKRLLPLMNEQTQAFANTRMALRTGKADVNKMIDALPLDLQADPGLSFDRFLWRARKGFSDSARTLILERSLTAATLGRPEEWANRRRSLARSEMRNGDPVIAYELAARHFLEDGSDYADLEWLSGYIALRKLNDPELALMHFQRFDHAVASPISKGRAGYWIGRAYEEMDDLEASYAAYKDGARYQTAFYGLLSAEKIGAEFDPLLAGKEPVADWREAPFKTSSVYEAGLLLLASDEPTLAERFLTHLAESLTREEALQLGQVAIDLGQPHLAVMIGKRVAKRGIVLPAAYYALHPMHRMNLPIAPEMALSIARRESEFDPVVTSGVGARGLMQIMPDTAREVARGLGINDHSTDRLLLDWDYNAKLGSSFLSTLAGRFGGNVVMISAAYNAGPSRPNRWMQERGDPRGSDSLTFDMIDWIEHIPFNETRNYVMRVTESLPIYRARLGLDPLPLPFSKELAGDTLLAFAPESE
jgi:soluble lytic murein transglycosylase